MPAPPGGGKPEIVAKIGAEFDASEVADGLRRMGTDWGKRMREIEKKSQKSMKGTGKSIKEFMWAAGGARKAYKRLFDDQLKGLKSVRTQYVASIKEARKAEAAVAGITAEMKALNAEAEPELFEKLNKRLQEAQKNAEKLRDASEKIGRQRTEAMEGVKEIKEQFTFDTDDIVDAMKEAGEELIGPFESLMNKDIPGAMEKAGKLVGKGWEKLFKGTGKLVTGMGKGFAGMGSKLAAKGKGVGGIGGAAMQGAGKAMGAIGKLVGQMGPMIKMIGTLGPILSTVSSLLVAVVKILIDAEAGAKELNKEIMSTAGTSEFFYKNMKNTSVAANDLEETLQDIRDSATSLDNMDWGISKETHTAVLNAITAEGVSLKKLDDDFKRVGKSSQEATGYAKDWGSMVQMSVAYSRAFGVSLNDISQLEGEMMSELGMDLDHVETSFQFMLKSAEESGIATNKFFGIIRGFSADLTLFNIRMEDVTKTLVMMGKAMSPREAQKMMQGLTSMFKGRDLLSRTKDVIMGGPAVARAMKSQQAGTVKGLASDIGISEDEMRTVLKKNDKDLAKWLAKNDKKVTADQRKAVMEAAIMQHKLDSGDTIDLASAIKDANPWTAKKIADAKVAAITGGKKIDQLTGINRIAAESAAEVSDELQDQIKKLAMNTEVMKADLAEKLKRANGDASQFSAEEQRMLTKLGVDIKDADASAKVASKTDEDFYNSLDDKQQNLLKDGKEAIDYQKETAHLQSSVLDKLQVLIDFIMNQIYDAFTALMDFTSDMLDLMDIGNKYAADRQSADMRRKSEKTFVKTGNKELVDAWNKSQGSLSEMNKQLKAQGGLFAKANESIDKQVQIIKDSQKKLDDPTTPQDQKKGLQDQIDAARGLLNEYRRTAVRQGDWKEIIKGMNLTSDQMAKMTAYAKSRGGTVAGEGGGDLMAALKQAGVTLDDDTIAKLAKAGVGTATNAGSMAAMGQDIARTLSTAEKPAEQQKKDLELLKTSREQAHQAELAALGIKTVADNATQKGSLFTHDVTAEEANETMMEEQERHGDVLDDIYRALRFRGIKIDKPFLQNQIRETLHDATFEAFSEALLDYYVMEHTDSDEVLKAIQKGDDPKTFARGLREAYRGGKGTLEEGKLKGLVAPQNATGGVVTSIRDGIAQVARAPAGEGLMAIRPGESYGGGGGGGGTVKLELGPNARKFFGVIAQDEISKAQSATRRR